MGHQLQNVPHRLLSLDMPDRDNIRVTIQTGNVVTYLQIEYDVAHVDLNEDESRARIIIEGQIRIMTERLESEVEDTESDHDSLDSDIAGSNENSNSSNNNGENFEE
jgi:hypothetical protein